MIIEHNTSKTLMIHSYNSKNFNTDQQSILNFDKIYNKSKNTLSAKFLELTKDYIYTFDDGLYQQYQILKLFPKERTIFFPSFGLLRPKNILPYPIENSIAHNNKKLYLSTFMSSTEVWDSMTHGYKLGSHGWYHLNLNLNYSDLENLSQIEILKLLKSDAKLNAEAYIQFILPRLNEYILNNFLELYYCTPYNIYNDYQKIYINLFKKYIEDVLKTLSITYPIKIKIFSFERESIEDFIYKNNLD